MSIMESIQVGFFQHLGATGTNVPLSKVLDRIKGGAWAGQIKRVLAAEKDSEQHRKLKAALPAFMVSASTKGGHKATDVMEHSGLLQIDVDGVGAEQAADLRDRLGDDRHILAAWISPSGDGVKAIMLIPASAEGHKASYAAASDYMRERHTVEIDKACSDVNRLCFVSHDPGLVVNLGAVPLDVPATLAEETHTANSSEYLNPESASAPYILHNSAFFEEWPDLKPLYRRLVYRYYGSPQRGQRNTVMVEIVSKLFYYMLPDFALGFALQYRIQNEGIFFDYTAASYEQQARVLLDGCAATYRNELPSSEKAAYDSMSDEAERTAFRICRSLSRCESEPSMPPPLFFLSCHELALRLGLFDPQASRILGQFQKLGIIEMQAKGTARAKGQKGVASSYTWTL